MAAKKVFSANFRLEGEFSSDDEIVLALLLHSGCHRVFELDCFFKGDAIKSLSSTEGVAPLAQILRHERLFFTKQH